MRLAAGEMGVRVQCRLTRGRVSHIHLTLSSPLCPWDQLTTLCVYKRSSSPLLSLGFSLSSSHFLSAHFLLAIQASQHRQLSSLSFLVHYQRIYCLIPSASPLQT